MQTINVTSQDIFELTSRIEEARKQNKPYVRVSSPWADFEFLIAVELTPHTMESRGFRTTEFLDNPPKSPEPELKADPVCKSEPVIRQAIRNVSVDINCHNKSALYDLLVKALQQSKSVDFENGLVQERSEMTKQGNQIFNILFTAILK